MKWCYIVNKKGFFNLYGIWLLSFLLLCANVLSYRVITFFQYQKTMENEVLYLFIIQHVNQQLYDLSKKQEANDISQEEEEDNIEPIELFPFKETLFYQGNAIHLLYEEEFVYVEFYKEAKQCKFQIHYEKDQYFIMKVEY
ncbi:MAG: hypothetical protein K2L08_04670 [Erysipelotrichaceae bacterium]|nr:hypothetical protein [Erysipelotrichaceae bacterium]